MSLRFSILVSVLIISHARAVVSVDGQWEYLVIGGNATIIKYKGIDSEIAIPNNIDGYPVYEIRGPAGGQSAFTNNPRSILLPNTLIKIGSSAFSGCMNLTNFNIPSSVIEIGESAFSSCRNLTNIIIPNSVKSIGASAFMSSVVLRKISIPNSVTNIGEWAFWNCAGATNILISENISNIGIHTFSGCSSLLEVNIPNNVTNISGSAFVSCYSITNVVIGSGVKSIANNSFGGNLSLTKMTFLGNAPSVSGDPFYDTPPFDLYYSQGTTGWGTTFAGRQTTMSGNYSLILGADSTKGSAVAFPAGNFFSPGASVTLTAMPLTGYVFTSWSGDSTSTINPLVLVMDANKAVTANFGPDNSDTDGDGLSNHQEVIIFNTDPNQAESNSPVAGLYLASQYQANRAGGRNEVLASPNSYGLFNSNQMLDLKFGGMVIGKSNNQLVLTYQINQSTNLTTWTAYREESLVLSNAPAHKMFLRLAPK